ncbi:PRTRC system ThiF family protein [Azotobacter beijerinckii]|uniref:PRTRC system ThiF family protein n=1 Tax=Azotobacter beijerinckii TaxID=170623 RepID=A0A1I1BGK4_9GAMM|nr:PRTRC system ThiF family protein [Azotobacter beijerinckii]SFB47888.1 PRTRC system ThiF family protein [Azotobacter beijerinckii]
MSAQALLAPQEVWFEAPERWMSDAVHLVVIGAGGNGSEVVDCLASFHHALVSLGHPKGLNVTIIDDAVVREPNLVRQRFWPCDLGQYKAVALANRYNLMLGLDWTGLPYRFPGPETEKAIACADLVITAVDLPSARRALAHYGGYFKPSCMWLDLGNGHRHGQAVFGALSPRHRERYPCVIDVYPELASLQDDPRKSCSAAESLGTQDCLINRAVTTAGMGIVWELLRYGRTAKHCLSISLETGEQMAASFPPP